ncbi:hypothetical protein AMATHDRAFT_69631 [Amanita thiersii Skay4041]|uniref:Uncharacterized protein n=1 Tax=Amanita thiersii Skay4041 TaxID=703135 RepID=A0A2A9NFV1_9AGAR|nr:hypothetical protein AMATHDRAFT_69631 [Amanita thiersii Skay4041]
MARLRVSGADGLAVEEYIEQARQRRLRRFYVRQLTDILSTASSGTSGRFPDSVLEVAPFLREYPYSLSRLTAFLESVISVITFFLYGLYTMWVSNHDLSLNSFN